MSRPQKVTVLDCTLRDGGYYNSWDFDPETVEVYLAAVGNARVDAVEVGFRSPAQDRFFGAFAFTTDDLLAHLSLPEGPLIAVMVNASHLLADPEGPVAAIDRLFRPRRQSSVGLVRIAAHFREVPECGGAARRLRELGYRVAVNVMQVGGKPVSKLAATARTVREWDAVEVLYFADSLGSMDPAAVRTAVSGFASEWPGSLGIHTHDNKGLALSNCLAALEAGVTWFDCTVLGMGRGAGNVRTEYLLLELTRGGFGPYEPDALFPLVIEDFRALRDKYDWGPNLLYYLSATYGIHPTYVQELLGGARYSTEHIFAALDFLRQSGASSFDAGNLQRALIGSGGTGSGGWDARGWAKGRTVLIIGPGPGARRHMSALCRFIDRVDPLVLCLNVNRAVPTERVTAYVACHETRMLIEADQYSGLSQPLITPLDLVPNAVRGRLDGKEVWDYGLKVEEDTLRIDSTGCTLPSALAVAYALAIATAGGAERILMAGFDGYDPDDPRQEEMIRLIKLYEGLAGAVPVAAVTPTTYPLQQSSIYAPDL